jgi:hypothetical protein
MPDKIPDNGPRSVAVFLGASGSGQTLLNILGPLLEKQMGVDLQGVFAIDDDLRHAADLPFVKELCRLTYSVREFHGPEFERTIALRTRTARKALEQLARRTGVDFKFHDVRGATVNILHNTVLSADITFFEPVRLFVAQQVSSPAARRPHRRRIIVFIDDIETGGHALDAAVLLAEGRMQNVTVLINARTMADVDAGQKFVRGRLLTDPAEIIFLPESGPLALIAAVKAKRAGMLILSASEETVKPESLRSLLDQLPCPVCLVRSWRAPNT